METIITIEGRVVKGKQMGRQLGFPTANIAPARACDLPENGVYAAYITVDGVKHKCVLNQGKHPTLPEGEPTIEAHILDFSGDIYGKDVTVDYVSFRRAEQKFSSLEELIARIEQDAATAREVLQ